MPRRSLPVTAVLAPLLLAAGTLVFGAALFGGGFGAAGADVGGETRIRGDHFPKRLENGGDVHVVAGAPRRIASLTVAADEILTRLVPPERLVAVSRFAGDPYISTCADRLPARAARIRGVDPEHIVSLTPDEVFVAHYTLDSAVRILDGAGIPFVRFRNVHSYDDVAANVRLTGAAVGEEARAEALLSDLRARLSRVGERVAGRPRPRVLYYSPVDYTAGTDTLVDEKIRLSGGANAAAEIGLVGAKNVSLDVLIGLDPEVIVVPRWSTDATGPVRGVVQNAAWRDVRAVRTGRVYTVSAAALTSESPDGVVGVEELAHLLHPEAFTS